MAAIPGPAASTAAAVHWNEVKPGSTQRLRDSEMHGKRVVFIHVRPQRPSDDVEYGVGCGTGGPARRQWVGKGALPNGWRLCRWLLPDGIRLGESASIEVEVEVMTLLPAGPGASGRGPGLRAMEVGEGGMAGGRFQRRKKVHPVTRHPDQIVDKSGRTPKERV